MNVCTRQSTLDFAATAWVLPDSGGYFYAITWFLGGLPSAHGQLERVGRFKKCTSTKVKVLKVV